MRPEIVIILYCIVALSNFPGSPLRQIFGSWCWNDLSYALRLFILTIPLYVKMKTLDIWNKFFIAILLTSNMVTILSDYKFIDLYDKVLNTPKICFIISVLLYNIYKLKYHKTKE